MCSIGICGINHFTLRNFAVVAIDFLVTVYRGSPDSKFGWANVGPTSRLSAQRWPNVSPTNLAVWEYNENYIKAEVSRYPGYFREPH